MKRIRVLLLLTLLTSLAAGYAGRLFFPGKAVDERAQLRLLAPAEEISEKGGAPPHYSLSNGSIAFNTFDITPSVRGYAGPIRLLVILSPDGRISGVRIIGHQETKNYVHYMESPDYLNRLVGKSVHDPFLPDRDIDAITRATVSVDALARTLRESTRQVASGVFGIRSRGGDTKGGQDITWLWYLITSAAAFLLYLATRRTAGLLRTRDFVLAASVAVIGLYLSSPFSILQVFNVLLGRFSASGLWYVVVATTLLSTALAGRFYCGWLCPFGALSEFIGRIPARKWTIPQEVDDRWRNIKYVVLTVITGVVLISGRTDYGNIETYVTLYSWNGTYLAWALVAVTLAANLRITRFWCRYLCPVAAFTGVLSRVSPGYPSRSDCPMGNRRDPLLSECIRCNRCYHTAAPGRKS